MELLLTYISRKLQIDAHYLYKGFFWIGIASAVFFVANFFRATIFANFLLPETYGTYRYVLSIIEITTALGLTGTGHVISRSVAQGYEGSYIKGVTTCLKRSWLSVLAASAVGFYFLYKGNEVLALTFILAGFLSPLFQSLILYSSLLEGKKLQTLNSKFQIFSTLIPTLLLVPIVLYTESVLLIVVGYFLSFIITHSFFAYLSYKIVKPNNTLDPQSNRFTFHLSVMGTLGVIVEQIDKVLLFHFIGPAQLAAYSFAASLPSQFNVFSKGLKSLIYPKISIEPLASVKKNILRKAFLIFLFSLVLFTVYALSAPFIFRQFFPQYTEAILLSQVFALSIFLMLSVPYRSVLLAHSCTKELYQAKIASMTVRIVSLAILLPLLGVWGVVISYLVTKFLEQSIFMYTVHFKISDKNDQIDDVNIDQLLDRPDTV